mmetsp:Transcript_13455/g.32924  ORF Transcript_13455/g.32924 Transcript_13455/m.32924 type:complete len:239 (-) Transcript_13455:4931-5647(-)
MCPRTGLARTSSSSRRVAAGGRAGRRGGRGRLPALLRCLVAPPSSSHSLSSSRPLLHKARPLAVLAQPRLHSLQRPSQLLRRRQGRRLPPARCLQWPHPPAASSGHPQRWQQHQRPQAALVLGPSTLVPCLLGRRQRQQAQPRTRSVQQPHNRRQQRQLLSSRRNPPPLPPPSLLPHPAHSRQLGPGLLRARRQARAPRRRQQQRRVWHNSRLLRLWRHRLLDLHPSKCRCHPGSSKQ